MIDYKGRLFGRINVIDLGIFLLAMGLTLTGYFGYKMIPHPVEKTANAEITVRFSILFPELANAIKAGDVDRDVEGRVVGRIENVISNYPITAPIAPQSRYAMEIIENPRGVLANLRISCRTKGGELYYKKETIKIGNTITFSPERYEIFGTIIDIKSVDRKNREIK